MTPEPEGLAQLQREVWSAEAIELQPGGYQGVLARMLAGKPVKAGEAATVTAALVAAARDMQISARRYADGRSTYVTAEVNGHTRVLLALGIPLNTADGSVWARDGMYGAPAEPAVVTAAVGVSVSPGLLLEAVQEEVKGRDLPTARLARLIAGEAAALEEPVTPPEGNEPVRATFRSESEITASAVVSGQHKDGGS